MLFKKKTFLEHQFDLISQTPFIIKNQKSILLQLVHKKNIYMYNIIHPCRGLRLVAVS